MVSLGAGAISCLVWPPPPCAATLIFAHANGFNAQTYSSFLAPLSDSFHVFAVDLRGHGFSTVPATSGLAKGWSVFRDDLVALAGQLTESPVILAGHSLGATASLMAAAAAPARVRGLVLIEPVLMPPFRPGAPPSRDLAQRAAQRRNIFPTLETALRAYRGRSIFTSWPNSVLRDYLKGGLIETAEGSFRLACAPEWEAEIFREPPHAVAAFAGDIACPLTILHGTISSTASPQELDVILRGKPSTRVVKVEGAGHFLPIEQPELVRAEIRRTAAGS